MGELGFQFVEAGLAEARGAVADDTGDGAADAVCAVAVFGNQTLHALGRFVVGAAHGEVAVDVVAGDSLNEGQELGVGRGGGVGGRGWEEELWADGVCEGDDFNAVCLSEVFLGDCARCDTACGVSV